MSYVLDTSALSSLMHKEREALDRIRAIDPYSLILCSPVAAEVHFGLANLVETSTRRRILEDQFGLLRSVMRWVDWGAEAARTFGHIKADLRRRGTPIQDFDIAIASVALSLGASLATRNLRHFSLVSGLKVEDWS